MSRFLNTEAVLLSGQAAVAALRLLLDLQARGVVSRAMSRDARGAYISMATGSAFQHVNKEVHVGGRHIMRQAGVGTLRSAACVLIIVGATKERSMALPDLTRIVETHIPIVETGLTHLRRDVLPYIRKLQADGGLRWFCLLLHPASELTGHESVDKNAVVHIRLEPRPEVDVDTFIKMLPIHFLDPQQVTLSTISGVELSMLRDGDWAHGWKLVGDASEWVLCLLEAHKEEFSIQEVAQFLHFITNPLTLGHRCLCIPGGFIPF
jgi:hypothetical protein